MGSSQGERRLLGRMAQEMSLISNMISDIESGFEDLIGQLDHSGAVRANGEVMQSLDLVQQMVNALGMLMKALEKHDPAQDFDVAAHLESIVKIEGLRTRLAGSLPAGSSVQHAPDVWI